MSNKISELNTKRNKLLASAQVLVNEGRATSEEYRNTITEIDSTQEHIDMLHRVERALPNLPPPAPVVPVVTPESREQRRAKLNSAFRSYLQGTLDQRIPEHRDLETSSDGAGGAAIPQEFSGFLSETLKYYCPFFNYANVRQNPNGRSVKICVWTIARTA